MWKTEEGSTGSLLKLCIGYFIFYVITGVTVKYFQGKADMSLPGMKEIAFTTYSTLGGTAICMAIVVALGWYRLQSNGLVQWGPIRFPGEYVYIIPSGVCTAVVITTTTLMYSLPISIMVAMVIMRGGVIVISLLVDLVQKWQGILTKKIYWQESVAVAFAISAVVVVLVLGSTQGRKGDLSPAAGVIIFSSYILAYLLRIYVMNYFKNTRGKGVRQDNKGFFAIEQIAATATLCVLAPVLYKAGGWFGSESKHLDVYRGAIQHPHALWGWATLAGMAFGLVAFFSVFLFMFKGRTATFAGLVNRLTSLIAGTTATVIFYFMYRDRGVKAPEYQDWISLGLILVAVAFLSFAERRRTAELAATGQLAPAFGTSVWVNPQKP